VDCLPSNIENSSICLDILSRWERHECHARARARARNAIPVLINSMSATDYSINCFSNKKKASLIAGFARFVIGQYVTVHGDVISHVNISHVMVEDGGEYSCTAENRAGKVTHAARLNVYGA